MYRLLFVDDEALIREGVSENVRWNELGYELAGTCGDGREACEFLRQNRVDVVMTDICMPFLDGMELSAYIQREFPHIKVLILSGYDDFEYAKSAIKYGVEEYILKPITSLELGDVLTELRAKLDREREEERRRSDIYAVYRKSRLLLCSDALLHVITGSMSEEECRKELAELDISLTGPFYLAAVAGLSIYTGDYELNEKRKKESALMAFIVFNLAQEIVRRYGAGEVCQGRDNRVFLLFQSGEMGKLRERALDICGEIIDQVRTTMNMSLNIGMGGVREGMSHIYRSYEEAERALLMQYTFGENCVIDIQAYTREPSLPAELERIEDNLVRHMREYEQEKAESDLKELSGALRRSGAGRKEAVDTLLRVCGKLDGLLETLGVTERQELRETELNVIGAPLLENAAALVSEYVKEAMERLAGAGGPGGRGLAWKAYTYLEKHYGDKNLNLQAVCAHLSVSTSRFSSIFKQTFGSTFMDVLINIRMKKARELLEMTELKNYEIAEKVGFSDPHYFSIAFKKASGMTPTEYARSRRQE